MEFHEKLQELRKRKGLTQEALAEQLYVSRTAISKWESGRGYPNIESLKAISRFFGVTIDDLLSGEQLLCLAEADRKQRESHLRDLIFGSLDLCSALLLFLPFFAQKVDGEIHAGSLLVLDAMASYLRIACFIVLLGSTVIGVLTLALQNCSTGLWLRWKHKVSVLWNLTGLILFIASLQPYAAVFTLVFFAIKAVLLMKRP